MMIVVTKTSDETRQRSIKLNNISTAPLEPQRTINTMPSRLPGGRLFIVFLGGLMS